MPATLVEPSSQIQRNPVIRSWMAVSCSCMCTELLGTFGVIKRGGVGSGVIFSSTRTTGLVCKASDMCRGVRVDVRVEGRGWSLQRCPRALLMCERSSLFEL